VEVDRQEEVEQDRVVGWNLGAMMEKETEEVEELWMELAQK
jgi:hypothetical protein